jgi:hypothetical protein
MGDSIISFKYFEWGKALADVPIYGLYEPVLDKFLIVLDSKEHAELLKYLLSSRYHIFICRLDLANNFKSIGMDNSCCHYWSFVDRDRNLQLALGLSNTDPVIVEEFCDSSSTKIWDIDKERQWIMFCHYVLRHLIDYQNGQYKKASGIVNQILKLDEFDNLTSYSTRQKIFSILYFGNNIDTAEYQLRTLLGTTKQELLF